MPYQPTPMFESLLGNPPSQEQTKPISRETVQLLVENYKSSREIIRDSLVYPEHFTSSSREITKLLEDLKVTIQLQNKLTDKLLENLLKL